MPATTSGTKTVTKDLAPHLKATYLTTLCASAVENLTIAQLRDLNDAVKRTGKGHDPGQTIGALFV